MSLPSFPNSDNTPTREEVINQIISSIAMEELGLSHIINAEGEKMQYALGTIPGVSGPEEPLTMQELLDLNESIHQTLNSTMMNQFFLRDKLINALSASVMQGPTGPTGPQGPATIGVSTVVTPLEPEDSPTVANIGPSDQQVVLQFGIPRGATGAAGAAILGSYDNVYELVNEHPTGAVGDAYLVGGSLYVWSEESASWQDMGSITGPTGATGAAGAAILGSYDNLQNFIVEHPTGTAGDAYLVEGVLYVWGGTPGSWQDMGSIVGPTGATGAAGAVILDSYDNYANFIIEHPTGTAGDAYLVGGVLYVWGGDPAGWQDMGSLVGPAGAGIEILGSYDTLVDLQTAHPTGAAGEVYAVDGVLYYWNEQTPAWEAIDNLNGPTGPAGAGIEILGSYDTLVDLQTAHPTGAPGQVYAVDGVLYYWNDDTPAWEAIDNLNGPTGPTGPTGPAGAGIAILGSYDTLIDLQTAHPTGAAGELYAVNGSLYYWNDDTGAWEAIENLSGPTGPTGPAGAGIEILGSYGTLIELQTAHPTGAAGQVYAVDGILYYWNEQATAWEAIENLYGPTGPTGPAGPAGPESSSYTIIPFASQMAPRTYANNGAPTTVTLLGFSYFDTTGNVFAIPNMAVNLEANGAFVLGPNNQNRQLVFSVPYDATIRSIYATVGNALEFNPSGAVYPYIQIYQAAADSNVFFPILEARAEPVLALGPGTMPEATARPAFVDGLNINVSAGTRIAIGGLMRITGDMNSRDYYLYFTGGLSLSRSV